MIRRYLDERIHHLTCRLVPWRRLRWLRPLVGKCLWLAFDLALAMALGKKGGKVPLNSPAIARSNLEKIRPKRAMLFTTAKPFQASACDLSVIVPVYNAEAFIARSLDSLLAQRLAASYEIIVVNDGSTDGTARILERYAPMPAVKIITQPNRGLSAARNAGLDAAAGEYVFFLDADDFAEPGGLAALLDKAFGIDADIVDGSWCYVVSGKVVTPEIYPERILELSGSYPAWHNGYACGKLMKRVLWKRARFPEGAVSEDTFFPCEDSILSYLIHAQCKKYASISTVTFNYCRNPSSITLTMHDDPRTLTLLWMFENLFDFLSHDAEFSFNWQLSDWALVHCSALLLDTMGHFGDEVLCDVFVVATEILRRHDLLGEKPGRKYLNAIARAFRENDFIAWRTLARYY